MRLTRTAFGAILAAVALMVGIGVSAAPAHAAPKHLTALAAATVQSAPKHLVAPSAVIAVGFTAGNGTARCTYSGSIVQQVNGTVYWDKTTTQIGTTSVRWISDKGLRSISLKQFDNTGASGGSYTESNPPGSGTRSGHWFYQQRTRNPYLRLIATATDGQTCTFRKTLG